MASRVIERAGKTARVELKTSDEAKDTLRQAAAAYGLDLSSFIISAAIERAEMVLERQRRRELSESGWTQLNEVLNSQSAPTPALVALMRGKSKDERDTTREKRRKH
ncbi:DUF1778 domain-containing protein [Pseudomonas xanthosomatis]|uniref:DUF1778 domain-containing protein n=1 Tax=Pseudomonas xanthosomatis TaxID=2842356 RepID=UPI0035135A8B